MNQYSEEIHKELEELANKYHITKGILLIEEINQKDPKKTNARAILFQPSPKSKFSVHEFAVFYEAVLKVSRTFREIYNHMTMHMLEQSIQESVGGSTIDQRIKKGGKRVD